MLLQELGDHLGVGVAAEDHAFVLQLFLEDRVIFDDAVVDERDSAIGAEMRMGVAIVGGTVRGPARVADAVAPGGGLLGQILREIGDAACSFAQMQMRPRQGGDAGAVVAAIFQTA